MHGDQNANSCAFASLDEATTKMVTQTIRLPPMLPLGLTVMPNARTMLMGIMQRWCSGAAAAVAGHQMHAVICPPKLQDLLDSTLAKDDLGQLLES